VALPQLAQLTGGYTGADITAVCREAALAALEESLESSEVCWRHFEAALQAVPPSTPASGAMLAMFEQFQRSAQ
jgi:SpoVK/Ycf46/Vps4 family AAA+-type ATPase